jgi:hypothetical protein
MASLKCNIGRGMREGTLDGVLITENVHMWHLLLDVSEDFIRRRIILGLTMDEIIIEAKEHRAKQPNKKGWSRSAKVELVRSFCLNPQRSA